MNNKIELLSPAGDPDAFKAAVLAGADAVYFGLERFSARTRATNITLEQLETLAPLAKSRNIKLYLTLNTLIKDNEMGDALLLAAEAIERGADAIIVQDTGVISALRAKFPSIELHASTQMTTHNIDQLEVLAKLGVSQVNLSRELSIEQIKYMSEKLKTYGIIPEVFVHGAYCISYSGQCYLSGALYGQAGNRGSCVQPCRRQFCTVNSAFMSPFSLKDNCAFEFAKDLCSFSPISLKIEGRIKNAEYVYTVTKSWREQLDLIKNGLETSKESETLNKAFNRGFSTDYLEGCPTQDFFNNGQKDATQQKAGNVFSYSADKKLLEISNGTIAQNDRLLIKTSKDDFICTALVLETKNEKNGTKAIIKITGKLNGKIEKGQIVYKSSPIFNVQTLQTQIDELKPVEKCISAKVCGSTGTPLSCSFSAENITVEAQTELLLEKANKQGLCLENIKAKLGRLGGTGFVLKDIDASSLQDGLFIAPQALNELRRICVQKLQTAMQKKDGTASNKTALPQNTKTLNWQQIFESRQNSQNNLKHSPELAFLCSDLKAAETLLKQQKTVILELPLVISAETQNFLVQNQKIIPHFQSILFEEDLQTAKTLLLTLKNSPNFKADRSVWCENTGLADFAHKQGFCTILGSFANATNSNAIFAYSKLLGADAIVPSLEISADDINRLEKPENTKFFMFLYANELLMQSRQCLLHNLSGCKKEVCDRTCIENCSKELICKGKAGETLKAIKRPGFYSSLYGAKPASNAKAFSKLHSKIDTWIIDLRFKDENAQLNLIEKAEKFIQNGTKQKTEEPFKDAEEKQSWF